MSRRLASAWLLVCIACVSRSAGEGTEEAAESTTESGEVETAAETETETGTETGDPIDPACEADSPLARAEAYFLWAGLDYLEELPVGPLACEIVDRETDFTNELYRLNCLVDDVSQPGELHLSLVANDAPSAYPLEVGQSIELDWTLVGSWEGRIDGLAFSVREAVSGRLLLLSYFGWELPQDLEPVIPQSFYAPLTVVGVDTVCPEDCEDYPGLGVPPECICVRARVLEFRAAAAPLVVVDHGAGYLEIPGEPDGFVGVVEAIYCDSDSKFDLFYVAGVGG